MKARILTVIISGSLLLSGCSVVNFFTPYKLDIPQGNEITIDQVAKLKVGMSQNQVRFVLGTPLLVDPFHQTQWVYLSRDTRGDTLLESKRLTLYFQENSLVKWEGDALPEPIERIEARKADPAQVNDTSSKSNNTVPSNSAAPNAETEVKPLIDKGF
ncbi:outer membrane protein assembly factor BamE [Chitinibacter bivalviorum]|uniref:Outer membrane protein assembly factor BamE n=1 Tax=Chitinibacter bivalviorum TaxID=2739434 RepID=A0A7H9BIQ7_9NEIS|nr:outer membrane protein assembly factor BamE [Chitinibacter bivalviorum]QLG88252.1 outer membrane protein assembly factor BamE [Chitinibacter bivalviorum]